MSSSQLTQPGQWKLTFHPLEIPYEFTFTISRHSHTHTTTVIVALHYQQPDGSQYVGMGEAVPSAFYGESAESVGAFYAQLCQQHTLEGLTPFDIQKLENRLSLYEGHFAAKSAIDMAFYDLQGKILNRPVWQLWGLDPAESPKSSYTIGIADLETTQRKTEIALARGYDVLKVKLGSPQDIPLFEAIRQLAPHPDIILRVDANAAWELSQALEICQFLHENHVEFVEEPLKPTCSPEDYAQLKASSPLPLMADESCHRLGDIPHCAQYFHAINLKHTKTGGLSEARRMISAARAHGLRIMLGGFGESSLSITAFAQLAPLVDYCDLDGALLMGEDAYEGIQFEGSRFTLPTRPGLGVQPRMGAPTLPIG